MKAKKRLLTSIVCLILSLAVSVWACFAWFTSNSAVEANGVNSPVKTSGTNISVTAYYLNQAFSTNTITYSVTDKHRSDTNNDTIIDDNETMLQYNLDPLSATAVLLEFTCTSDNAGVYKVSAECEADTVEAKPQGGNSTTNFTSNLSNVVHFNDLTITAKTAYDISHDETQYSFVRGNTINRSKDVKEVSFTEDDKVLENGKNVYKKTVYIHMDYDAAHIDYLFGTLGNPGALKYIEFKNDITFKLTEGSPNCVPDSNVASEDVIAMIAALPVASEITLDNKTAIQTARAAYDRLSATQQQEVGDITKLTDAEAKYDDLSSANVISLITALPPVDSLTLEKEADVKAARKAYEELTANGKTIVGNSNEAILIDAEAKITELKGQGSDTGDTAKVENVETLISAIGTVDTSAECKKKIDDARAAYNALSTKELKDKVKNYSTLTDAEAKHTKLTNDEKAVNDVINKINKIGTVTKDSGTAITTARNAYDALTDTQKSLVDDSYKTKLTNAETEYVIALIDALPAKDAVTLSDEDAVKAARAAYDALDASQKTAVGDIAKLTEAEAKIDEFAKQTITCAFNGPASKPAGHPTNTMFTLTGGSNKDAKGSPVTVDGVTYNKGLKMGRDGGATVSFTLPANSEAKTLTLYFFSSNDKKVIVDGTEYTIGSDNIVTITIEASAEQKEHTITSSTKEIYLFFLKLGPKN